MSLLRVSDPVICLLLAVACVLSSGCGGAVDDQMAPGEASQRPISDSSTEAPTTGDASGSGGASPATGNAAPAGEESESIQFSLEAPRPPLSPQSITESDTSPRPSPEASVPPETVRLPEAEAMSSDSPVLMAPRPAPVVRAPKMAVRNGSEPDTAAAAPMTSPITEESSAVAEEMPEELATERLPAEPPSAETTSPSGQGGMPLALRAPVAEKRDDYEVVTVFYGTDRDSNVVSGRPRLPHRLWFYAAGLCVVVVALFGLLATASDRKKTFGSLAVASFALGILMALAGTIAWRQSEGAVAGPEVEYKNGRGEFVMGTCEVSIPRDHQVAELEAPSVLKLDFVEDPTKHVVLLDIEEKDSETFFAQLRNRVSDSATKDAFVFIHGFNVKFRDAARRTAQLAYDLKFQGAPIFYSWPSQGGLFQYAVDETNVVWTVPHLRHFLEEIAEQSSAKSVHLIAHSMGNRALTSALRELALERRDLEPLFHEVVLTAPDIDAEIFRRDIAPAIVKTAQRVTLYASSNDEALVLSKQVHGYPRAGDSGDGLVVIPGIETIDVSAVDTSLLGHNYYGDNATVISDMIDLVRNSKSARERSWLQTARLDDLFYWIFCPQGGVGADPVAAAPEL